MSALDACSNIPNPTAQQPLNVGDMRLTLSRSKQQQDLYVIFAENAICWRNHQPRNQSNGKSKWRKT
jgi:hypothetical protein